jgi:hypothetical protein
METKCRSAGIERIHRPNTTATVHVPAAAAANVTESGRPAGLAEGGKFLRMNNGSALYEVGSGTYRFACKRPAAAALREEAFRENQPPAGVGLLPTGRDQGATIPDLAQALLPQVRGEQGCRRGQEGPPRRWTRGYA